MIWNGLVVAGLVARENLLAPSHSLDDDYPEGLFEMFGAWLSTAVMAWREYEQFELRVG